MIKSFIISSMLQIYDTTHHKKEEIRSPLGGLLSKIYCIYIYTWLIFVLIDKRMQRLRHYKSTAPVANKTKLSVVVIGENRNIKYWLLGASMEGQKKNCSLCWGTPQVQPMSLKQGACKHGRDRKKTGRFLPHSYFMARSDDVDVDVGTWSN